MIDKLLADHRTGQDATQLGSFVLGGRTLWGTYKQALRELYKRIRGLRTMITERDLLLLDIEEMQEDLLQATGREEKRLCIKLRQKEGSLEEADRGIRDTKREAALFYRTAEELKLAFGEICEERRAMLDREEWKWWHIKKAAVTLKLTGRPDEVVVKNLASLPTAEREEWISVLGDKNLLMSTLENSEYGRQSLPEPTDEEIKLIEQEVSK